VTHEHQHQQNKQSWLLGFRFLVHMLPLWNLFEGLRRKMSDIHITIFREFDEKRFKFSFADGGIETRDESAHGFAGGHANIWDIVSSRKSDKR